jgi:membrane protease YdiL (CAAX protease family)
VLAIVGFFGVVWVLGWVRVDGGEVAERGVAGVLALLAAGLVMFAASALVQELAFRGYFFQNLAERLPTRTAAVVAGLIFAALHLAPVDEFSPLLAVVVVADLTLMACFLTLTRLSTGMLWMAIGFHTAWNWTTCSRSTPTPGLTTATRWSTLASAGRSCSAGTTAARSCCTH